MDELSDIIACVGWGSLIWQQKGLPVDSDWFYDGPVLPLEFARHSGKKSGEDRLTLVLLSSGAPVTTRWARLQVSGLEGAKEALRKREGCMPGDIGYWPGGPSSAFASTIGGWAQRKNLRGVVWTALPAKFADDVGRVPTKDEALSFLSALSGQARELAEEYVRMAPRAVQTSYRTAFERELGWLPLSKD